MSDELEICAAAFFRVKGKEVTTEKEFTFSVTLELKWLSAKDADRLLKLLVEKGIITRNNGYVKAAKDLSNIQVPIAYRPSDSLKKLLADTAAKPSAPLANDPPKDIFIEMMDLAVSMGLAKGKFVSECNILKKKLGVDTDVAALLLLRDMGADISVLKGRVYTQALER